MMISHLLTAECPQSPKQLVDEMKVLFVICHTDMFVILLIKLCTGSKGI